MVAARRRLGLPTPGWLAAAIEISVGTSGGPSVSAAGASDSVVTPSYTTHETLFLSVSNRISRPQGKRHFTLIRATVGNDPHNRGGLVVFQAEPLGATTPFRFQGGMPARLVGRPPTMNRSASDTKRPCRVRLGYSLPNHRIDDPAAQILLRRGTQPPCILSFHILKTHSTTDLFYISCSG